MSPDNPPINDMSFLMNDLGMLPKVAALPGYEDADAAKINFWKQFDVLQTVLNEQGRLRQ